MIGNINEALDVWYEDLVLEDLHMHKHLAMYLMQVGIPAPWHQIIAMRGNFREVLLEKLNYLHDPYQTILRAFDCFEVVLFGCLIQLHHIFTKLISLLSIFFLKIAKLFSFIEP